VTDWTCGIRKFFETEAGGPQGDADVRGFFEAMLKRAKERLDTKKSV
jgi:hypothetical protein